MSSNNLTVVSASRGFHGFMFTVCVSVQDIRTVMASAATAPQDWTGFMTQTCEDDPTPMSRKCQCWGPSLSIRKARVVDPHLAKQVVKPHKPPLERHLSRGGHVGRVSGVVIDHNAWTQHHPLI